MSKYNLILPQHDHPKTVYQKGGIAPPSFNLMNIQNAGKLRLDHFSSSPFSFVHEALSTLQNEHYPIASISSKFIFRPETPSSLHDTPDSAKYRRLVQNMLQEDLDEKLTVHPSSDPVIILQLFAVIKEVKSSEVQSEQDIHSKITENLARPIKNGHPVTRKSLQLSTQEKFSLPGSTQVVQFLNIFDGKGKRAINLDLANYYFQIKNLQPRQHGFRCGKDVFLWKVLTMGWDEATRIAQALTMDIVCRGTSLEASAVLSTTPPGLLTSTDLSTVAFCIYECAHLT